MARALSGAVWAWTALRLSGIEFATGAHLANNLVLVLMIEPISEGAQTGREYAPGALVLDAGIHLAGVAVLLLALRSRTIQAWAAPENTPPRIADAFD
jgi:membrane protease YdiL (CAAX protease family)